MSKTGTALVLAVRLLETVLKGQAGAGVPLAGTQKEGEYFIRMSVWILISSNRQNPGNNLHVSGLSHKVDTRDLEATFAKVGRVSHANVEPRSDYLSLLTGQESECYV